MKVRLTTLFLCTFLLWSSLLAFSHPSNFSKADEIKAVTETFYKVLAPAEDYVGEKLTYYTHIILVNFAFVKTYTRQERLRTFSSCTHRANKFYLLYKVLRN
jgi:hypothetical protein